MISDIESNCKILLINTYLKYIQDASDNFYKGYFTISPTVAYYYVWVEKISVDSSTNPTSIVTFISMPFVNAHWTVGIDEITFSADYVGNIKLKKFKHIISYYLPEHLKNLYMRNPIYGKNEAL